MLNRKPVVFISYSWTSKEYQEKVIKLAEKLCHDGIDVKFDVWDLKMGHDKYAYMEQCVTDSNIDKVLILCDKKYSEKADKRQGGVGDETAVISAELYGKSTQDKYIPVIMERDENGNVYLPAYLKSRMYIDLSEGHYTSNYINLVRQIYDQPDKRKPKVGTPPIWLTDDTYETKETQETNDNGQKTQNSITHNEEIKEYRNKYNTLRDEALQILAYYANAYMNPMETLPEYHKEAVKELRKVASRFDAFYRIKRLEEINEPKIEDLREVSKCFFGLSNGMYLHPREDVIKKIDHNEKLRNTIQDLLC